MNYPFIEGISDIQETQAAYSSRVTTQLSPRAGYLQTFLEYPPNNQNSDLLLNEQSEFAQIIASNLHSSRKNNQDEQNNFYSLREYVISSLSGMGLKMGYLEESPDNKQTIQCLLMLIKQYHQSQTQKNSLRQEITQLKFQKNKYMSLLEQAQKTNKEKNKKIGILENNFQELKNKLKKIEKESKKEREEDRKNIGMLKQKNEQVMHEIKKKEAEVTRIKEQMRKNVGQKQQLKTVNFQVYQPIIAKSKASNQGEQKVVMLSERFQAERKTLVKQNLLLKQKLYDIREEIINFAEWLDENIFGQKNNYSNKFIVNHNLLFRKQSIVDELNEVLADARSGIKQVMSAKQGISLSNQEENPQDLFRSQNLKFTSKNISPRHNFQKNNENRLRQSINIGDNRNKIQPRKTAPVYSNEVKMQKKKLNTPNLQRRQQRISPINEKISPNMNEEKSQIDDGEEISMISHISMSQMIKQEGKFDKWNILFGND